MTDFPPVSPLPPVRQPPSTAHTTSLVLGILSIVISGPVIGLILGIMAIKYSKRAEREISAGLIEKDAAGTAKAGYICGMVGTIISSIATLALCLVFTCWGLMAVGVIAGGAAGAGHHP